MKRKVTLTSSLILVLFLLTSCSTDQGRTEAAVTLAKTQSISENSSNSATPGEEYRFPEGTHLGVLEISGLTKEEALNEVEGLKKRLAGKTIYITAQDRSFELNYEKAAVIYNYEKAMDAIIAGDNHDSIRLVDYDRDKLGQFVGEIAATTDVKALKNKDGKALHQKDLIINIDANINDTEYDASLTAAFKTIKPQTVEMEGDDVIARIDSPYFNSSPDRVTNIMIASKEIDGVVLAPGEEFSFNSLVGDTSKAKGYKDGAVYTSDGMVNEPGGGICQVSTAIYNAAMNSGLRITDRSSHLYKVSYADYGMDATVYYPNIDFKFVNSYSFPIKIVVINRNNNLTVEILGDVGRLDGYSYEYVTKVTDFTDASWSYLEDRNISSGSQVVMSGQIQGATSSVYQKVYKNGKLLTEKLYTKDVYAPMNGLIKVAPGEVPRN